MAIGELLEWLLKKENKATCRLVAIFMIFIPIAFFLGGGFQGADLEGPIFTPGGLRAIFIAIMTVMLIVGFLIFLPAGFSRRKKETKEDE